MNRRKSVAFMTTMLVCSIVVSALPGQAPGQANGGKIKVVATIFPYADWVGRIGADRVEVTCLLPPGASPHTYELATKHVKVMRDAKLLIYNGAGLDDWVSRLVAVSADKEMVSVALGEQFPRSEVYHLGSDDGEKKAGGDGGEGHGRHDHSRVSCGMWLDPLRAVRMVDLIAEHLSRIDPAHRDEYQQRANYYWTQLDRLDRICRARLTTLDGGFIAFHESFTDLFRRYGVRTYGVVEPYPGKEPSVDYLRRLTASVSGRRVRGVLIEPQLSEKAAAVLADHIGTSVIRVDPIGGKDVPKRGSFIELMMYNLDQLAPRGAGKSEQHDER